MTDKVDAMDVGQADYMKLFMQELTYQDPLKPVDNREFMAQMAQFSALQQATEMNDKLNTLINVNYGNLGVNLFNKSVSIKGSQGYGSVEAMRFTNEGVAEVRIKLDQGGTTWEPVEKIDEALKEEI